MSNEGKKSNESIDTFVAVAAVIVVVSLLAIIVWKCSQAQAIQYELKFQTDGVQSNLHALRNGADQYYVDHNVSSVAYSTLIGTDSQSYMKGFQTVAGETYTPVIVKDSAITASGIAGARTVTYGP